MKPKVEFEVLDWASATEVIKVRVYGTDHRGIPINRTVTLLEPMTIAEVHAVLSKANNGGTRPIA